MQGCLPHVVTPVQTQLVSSSLWLLSPEVELLLQTLLLHCCHDAEEVTL